MNYAKSAKISEVEKTKTQVAVAACESVGVKTECYNVEAAQRLPQRKQT